MTTEPATTSAGYRRALAAEPCLRAVVATVDALCDFVRRGDTMCAGCVWERIVKPLTSPWIGWERGYPAEQADDPAERPLYRVVRASDLERRERRLPAETETEAWLRTSEAYDAFTDELLRRLDAADPGTGHGIHRRRTETR